MSALNTRSTRSSKLNVSSASLADSSSPSKETANDDGKSIANDGRRCSRRLEKVSDSESVAKTTNSKETDNLSTTRSLRNGSRNNQASTASGSDENARTTQQNKSENVSSQAENTEEAEENVGNDPPTPKATRSRSRQISETGSESESICSTKRYSTRSRKLDDFDDGIENATTGGKRSSSRLSQVSDVGSTESLTVTDKTTTRTRRRSSISQVSSAGSTENSQTTDAVTTRSRRRSSLSQVSSAGSTENSQTPDAVTTRTRRRSSLSQDSRAGSTENLSATDKNTNTGRRSSSRLSQVSGMGSTENLLVADKNTTATGRRSSSRLSQVSGMGSMENLSVVDKNITVTGRRSSSRLSQIAGIGTENLSVADKTVSRIGTRLPKIVECANFEENPSDAGTKVKIDEKSVNSTNETATSEEISSVPKDCDVSSSDAKAPDVKSTSRRVSSRLNNSVLEDSQKVASEPVTPKRVSSRLRKESETTDSEENCVVKNQSRKSTAASTVEDGERNEDSGSPRKGIESVGRKTRSSMINSVSEAGDKEGASKKNESMCENQNATENGINAESQLCSDRNSLRSPLKQGLKNLASETKHQSSTLNVADSDILCVSELTAKEECSSVDGASQESEDCVYFIHVKNSNRRSSRISESSSPLCSPGTTKSESLRQSGGLSSPVVRLVDCQKMNVSDSNMLDVAVDKNESLKINETLNPVVVLNDLPSSPSEDDKSKTVQMSENKTVRQSPRKSIKSSDTPSKDAETISSFAAESDALSSAESRAHRKSLSPSKRQIRAEEVESLCQTETENAVSSEESPRKRSKRNSESRSKENVAENCTSESPRTKNLTPGTPLNVGSPGSAKSRTYRKSFSENSSPKRQIRIEDAEKLCLTEIESLVNSEESPRKKSRRSSERGFKENITESCSSDSPKAQDTTSGIPSNDSVARITQKASVESDDEENSADDESEPMTDNEVSTEDFEEVSATKSSPTKQKEVSESTKENEHELEKATEEDKNVKVDRENEEISIEDSESDAELSNLHFSDEDVVAIDDDNNGNYDSDGSSETVILTDLTANDTAKHNVSKNNIGNRNKAAGKSQRPESTVSDNGSDVTVQEVVIRDDVDSGKKDRGEAGESNDDASSCDDQSKEGSEAEIEKETAVDNDQSQSILVEKEVVKNKRVSFSDDVSDPVVKPAKKSTIAKLSDPEYVCKINDYINSVLSGRQKLKEISRFSDGKNQKSGARKIDIVSAPLKIKPDPAKIPDKSNKVKNKTVPDSNGKLLGSVLKKKEGKIEKKSVQNGRESVTNKSDKYLESVLKKSEANVGKKSMQSGRESEASTNGKHLESVLKKSEAKCGKGSLQNGGETVVNTNGKHLEAISKKPAKSDEKLALSGKESAVKTNSKHPESVSSKSEAKIEKKSIQNSLESQLSTTKKQNITKDQNLDHEKLFEKTAPQLPRNEMFVKRKAKVDSVFDENAKRPKKHQSVVVAPTSETPTEKLDLKSSKKSKKKKKQNNSEHQSQKPSFDKAAHQMGFNVSETVGATAETSKEMGGNKKKVHTAWGKVLVNSPKNLTTVHKSKPADPANKWEIKPAPVNASSGAAEVTAVKKLKTFKTPKTFVVTPSVSKTTSTLDEPKSKWVSKSFKTKGPENSFASFYASQAPKELHQSKSNVMSVESSQHVPRIKIDSKVDGIGKKKKKNKKNKKDKASFKENSSDSLMKALVSSYLDNSKPSKASKKPLFEITDSSAVSSPVMRQSEHRDTKVEKKTHFGSTESNANSLKLASKARKLDVQDVFSRNETGKASSHKRLAPDNIAPVPLFLEKNRFMDGKSKKKRNLSTEPDVEFPVATKKPNLGKTKKTDVTSSECSSTNEGMKSLPSDFLKKLSDQPQQSLFSHENSTKKKKKKKRNRQNQGPHIPNVGGEFGSVLQDDFIPLSGGHQARFNVAVVDKLSSQNPGNVHFKNQHLQRKQLKREPAKNLISYRQKLQNPWRQQNST